MWPRPPDTTDKKGDFLGGARRTAQRQEVIKQAAEAQLRTQLLAQNLNFLLVDARAEVEHDHQGFGKNLESTVQATKNSLDLKGKILEKVGTKQAQKEIAIGVGVTLLGIGVTAAVAASHGAALPALIAIGAGTFLAKKATGAALSEVFNKPRTRDWLNKWDTVDHKTRGARSRALTDDATYSLRKLVVRYRKALADNAALEEVIRNLQLGHNIETREAWEEFARRFYKFNWEMWKLRNLLLPTMDAMLFMLYHYISVADRWHAFFTEFTKSVTAWLNNADNHKDCAKDGVCYAPSLQPKRSQQGLGAARHFTADMNAGEMAYKARFVEIIKALSQSDHDIEQAMKQGLAQPIDEMARVAKLQSRSKKSQKEIADLVRAVLDKGFAQAQAKKQGIPVLNMFRSWYEKSTKSEVFADVAKLGLGVTFAGVSPEISAVVTTTLSSTVVSPGVDAFGTTLFHLNLGQVVNDLIKGPKMLTQQLLNTVAEKVPKKFDKIDEDKVSYKSGNLTDDQWNLMGAKFESYFKRIGGHGTAGNEVLKDLQGLENKTPGSCAKLYAITKRIMEFTHHMDKMAHNCCKVLAFQEHMIYECIRLTYLERGYARTLVDQLCHWAARTK
jgi:hypothetical protein